MFQNVSIHAPAWGATTKLPNRPPDTFCFNPRARVGRDLWTAYWTPASNSFNPRARVGRDVPPPIILVSLVGFNPRARVGRDQHCSEEL